MRRYLDTRNNFGTIWSARTREFEITCRFTQTFDKYDGDDPDGETQDALDDGDLVMFDVDFSVEWTAPDFPDMPPIEIGWSSMGSSVYDDGETWRFVKDSGYFRDLLNEACDMARVTMSRMPKMRTKAAA